MPAPTKAIFFDDDRGQLAPLNDLRPVFDVRVAARTNLERVAHGLGLETAALWVPDRLEAMTKDLRNEPVNTVVSGVQHVTLVNGRLPVPIARIGSLEPGEALIEPATGDVIAAVTTPDAVERVVRGEASDLRQIEHHEAVLLRRPWHARSIRDAALEQDLADLSRKPGADLPAGVVAIGRKPIVVHPEATIYPTATLVAEDGPIVIARGAVVRPGAILIGPCFIGPRSTVVERATIRPATAIGPVCKVGGEIGGTIFQGYANKVHDGYLGDSWIGEWVNLGAGTNNSNLLNTYTDVVCQALPGGPRERTDETFLGAIIGDHVKAAIATRIMTGSVVHLGAMLASTAPISGCVAPFSWITDAGVRPYRLSKFVDTARIVMGRRDMEPTESYIATLTRLHEDAERFHPG